MKEKKQITIIDIIISPFLFIISFIKHFFIGVKFVFIDSLVNIINHNKNKRNFKDLSHASKEKVQTPSLAAKKESEKDRKSVV